MNPPHDMMHDSEPTLTPTHPGMAGAFDRLVETNLEAIAAMRELTLEVRALVKALTAKDSK